MTSSAAYACDIDPARGRRTAYRVGTFAVTLVALFAGLEGTLRAFGLPRPRELVVTGVEDPRGSSQAPFYEPDPVLLWKLKPGRVWNEFDAGYDDARINSRGLRGADREPEIVRSRLRVLCMGDSVTFGLALREEASYPAQLESALRDTRPELAPVVVNAGVPGYSSVQGARLLAQLSSIRPDVIVWWFGMNDGKPALGSRDSLIDSPVPLAAARRGAFENVRTLRFAESLAADLRGSTTRAVPEEVRSIVAELSRRAADGGPKVVFVKAPSRLAEKASQLESLAASVAERKVARVEGASDALSMFVPCAARSAEIDRVDVGGQEAVAVLREGRFGRESITPAELETRRDSVARWRDAVEAISSELPKDALGYPELFGGAPADAVFMDNCHLRAEGAKRAAAAIAARIDALLPPSDAVR